MVLINFSIYGFWDALATLPNSFKINTTKKELIITEANMDNTDDVNSSVPNKIFQLIVSLSKNNNTNNTTTIADIAK